MRDLGRCGLGGGGGARTRLVFSASFLAFTLVPYAVLQYHRQVLARDMLASSQKLEERRQLAEQRGRELATLHSDVEKRAQVLAGLAREVEASEGKARSLAAAIAGNQSRLGQNSPEREKTSAALSALRDAQGRIDASRADPEENVRSLRAHLRELHRDYDRNTLCPSAACPQTDRRELVSCQVRERVRARITELFQPLEQLVVPGIARVDESSVRELQQKLVALRRDLERRPLDNPDFWRVEGGRVTSRTPRGGGHCSPARGNRRWTPAPS